MSSHKSFLPEDYLARKAEMRTNAVCLVLFLVVMVGVFLAFVVTNRTWSTVKVQQAEVNAKYQQAAADIQKITELDEQKARMIVRAELAAALVERVPRSKLLAELVTCMPDRLSLLEFSLGSEKLKVVDRAALEEKNKAKSGPKRAPTKAEAEAAAEPQKVQPPKYRVTMSLVGVAPTDLEVSRYITALNAKDIFRDVTLDYSEEQEIEGQVMRKFKIDLRLNADADLRDGAAPEDAGRLRDAMPPLPSAPAGDTTASHDDD